MRRLIARSSLMRNSAFIPQEVRISALCVCGRCTGDILHAPHCGHFIDGRCSCGGTVNRLFRQSEEIERLYGLGEGGQCKSANAGSTS